MALASFNTPDTQPALVEVPLARIERGLRWMRAHPKVTARGDSIAVLGGSKGGDCPCSLPRPSGPRGTRGGICAQFRRLGRIDFKQPRGSTRSSWSLAGEPLPCVPYPAGVGPSSSERGLSVLPIYDRGLENAAAVAQAAIPIERATGPVLVISGGDDRRWPAKRMCVMVVDRARRAGRETLVRHLNFPEAGHVLTPYRAPASRAAMPMQFNLGGIPASARVPTRSRRPKSSAIFDSTALSVQTDKRLQPRGGRRDHRAAASHTPTWADSDSWDNSRGVQTRFNGVHIDTAS